MQKTEVEFHVIVAKEVQNLEYGQMTINVQLLDSQPILESLNIVKSKRKRYSTKNIDTSQNGDKI